MAQAASVSNLLTAGNLTSTGLSEAAIVVFTSLIIRSIIFITDLGELRVTPTCGQEGHVMEHQQMLKLCVGDSHRYCYFASADARFLLVAHPRTGRLSTIPTPEVLNAKRSDLCTAFHVRPESNAQGATIAACPGTHQARDLAFQGNRLKARHICGRTVGPFFQTASAVRHRQFLFNVQLALDTYTNEHCPRLNKIWIRCNGHLRDSYPLNFRGCGVSE